MVTQLLALLACALLASTSAWQVAVPKRALRPLRAAADDGHDGWTFEGRFIFAPQLVRAPARVPEGVDVVSLFGWTLGGVVALQYDASPVGAYLELVEMGALVTRNGCLGQWGERLVVSSDVAERACKDIWAVPAEAVPLAFDDAGESLAVSSSGGGFALAGWGRARGAGFLRSPRLPVLWTPAIKALWGPLKLPSGAPVDLAVHNLALSATSLAARAFADGRPDPEGRRRSLGFCLAADGLRIEIAPALGDRL